MGTFIFIIVILLIIGSISNSGSSSSKSSQRRSNNDYLSHNSNNSFDKVDTDLFKHFQMPTSLQDTINNPTLAEKIKCPKYLYHFTDEKNLESIKTLGGLYSWRYMENNNYPIPMPGGNKLSRDLDTRFQDWSDYVRLSFCQNHPMANRLKRNGYNLVILKIDSNIISDNSYISDRNATSNGANIVKASDIDNLQNFLDFNAINDTGYIEYGTQRYALHQAEVLIKTKVPYNYIKEIIRRR